MSPDVFVTSDRDLFWKKVGSGGWLYSGPVVFSAPARYSRETRSKVGIIVGAVPDDGSKLWIFCWEDAFTENEKVIVSDHELRLPLRFRSQVYEESISRVKNYLADRLFPNLSPERRTDLAWGGNESTGLWTLTVDRQEWTFGSAESGRGHTHVPIIDETDVLQALAQAVQAVIVETRGF